LNNKDKHALFCQFAEFLMNIKELLGFAKLMKDNRHVQELIPKIERTIKDYYLNFDCCSECNHPIPPLPSNKKMEELEKVYEKYISRYELKTGKLPPVNNSEENLLMIPKESEEHLPPALRGLKISNEDRPDATVDELLAEFLGIPKEEQTPGGPEEQPKKRKLTISNRLAELAEKDKKPVYKGKLVSIE
jgi:hypothetical protein